MSSNASEGASFALPGDPANRNFMMQNYGMSTFGGPPAYILVELWPNAGNLARLGPCLARVFAHTLRWGLVPPATPTLADFLALEGLAAAFVAAYLAQTGLHPADAIAHPTDVIVPSIVTPAHATPHRAQ